MDQLTINFNSGKLREAVANAGLTQAELARYAGVCRAAVHNILTGTSKPSVIVLAKICHRLNQPMDIFFEKMSIGG